MTYYLEKDAPPIQSATAILDPITGVAIDVPLGAQMPPSWWEEHPDDKARVLALREKHNVVVEDDWLLTVDTSGVTSDELPYDGDFVDPDFAGPKKTVVAKKRPGTKGVVSGRGSKSSVMSRAQGLYEDLDVKGTPGVFPAQLRKYWLGEGLSKWATTPTPFRSLVAALKREDVPAHMVDGLAAKLYRSHFGRWPGKQGGNK